MGRKKKPFIDKKKGTTYHLVPRSQADPLLDDPQEPQHVLKPDKSEVPLTTRDEQLTQQSYYGVHYTDDYDYLQHLREPGTAVLESVTAPSPDGGGMVSET
jgi:protein LTV1